MAMRARWAYQTGSNLAISVERLSDGLFYDFEVSAFVETPAQPTTPYPERVFPFVGSFQLTLDPTPPTVFTDGDYCLSVHNVTLNYEVVVELGATMKDGDDGPVFPPTSLTLSLPLVAAGATSQ